MRGDGPYAIGISAVTTFVPWLGLPLGAILWLANWRSIVYTIILPRSNASRITSIAWLGVQRAFILVVKRIPTYEAKDRWLALLGPISLLTNLVVWMLLFLLSYALLMWPFIAGSFGDALRLSGSSVFTLGIASSNRGGPIFLEFVAAATGMIIVALQIGYLPTLYGAYSRRETLVSALGIRGGTPAWGVEVLARHYESSAMSTLPKLFSAWETLAADIVESHVSYPWLVIFRSPDPLESWVISLVAVLDAAALQVSLTPSTAPPEARQCLRAGFVALRVLARMTGEQIEADPRPDDPIALPREGFMDGIERLREVEFPIECDLEAAWRDFCGWRVNYEHAAYLLADFVVAPPAPWTGQRTYVERREIIELMQNEPRNRTPENPEGEAPTVLRSPWERNVGKSDS